MAYIGNTPAESFASFEKQVFTIVNSQTAYTLDHKVTNENDIRLVINNVVQEPGSGKAYTASGTTLTLSAALVNGTDEMYCVFLGRALQTVNAPNASVGTSQLAADAVTEAKIADDAVESEHLNDNVISGQTELAVAPASTDELLISDAGVLKRIDVSLVGGDNTPAFFASHQSTQAISDTTQQKLVFTNEVFDTDSAYSSSRFTPQTSGKYFVFCNVTSNETDDFDDLTLSIYKNGSRIAMCRKTNSYYDSVNVSVVATLNGSSDYVEAYIYQNRGGNTDMGGSSSDFRTHFGAFKLIGV